MRTIIIKHISYIIIIQLITFFPKISFAQSEFLDSSFGYQGKINTTLGEFGDIVNSVVVQNDNKIIIGGASINKNLTSDFSLLRFDIDGKFDSSFGNAGKVITPIEQASIGNSIAIQKNGQILLGGASNWYINLVKYNSNGSLDSNFGTNGIVITDINGYYSEKCKSLAIQEDGKILVGGYASHNSKDKSYFIILRYNNNGTLDSSFGTEGISIGYEGRCNAICIQEDNKILLSGTAENNFGLMRFNYNGTIDSTFGNNGITITSFGNNSISESNAVSIQTNNKIIQAGFSNIIGNISNFSMARFHLNGTLDSSFGTDGKVLTIVGSTSSKCNALKILSDEKILLAGQGSKGVNYSDFALVRYTINGTIDSSFGNEGKIISSFANSSTFCNALELNKDGKIILAGIGNNSTRSFIAILMHKQDFNTEITNSNNNQILFNVFPNPFNSILTIQFHYGNLLNKQLIIYNMNGQKVTEVSCINETEVKIEREDIPSGIYYLHIIHEGKPIFVQKILISDN